MRFGQKVPTKYNSVILAQESNSIPDMFLRRVELSGYRRAYQSKRVGQWITTSWKGFYNQAASVASYLLSEGLQNGEKVCIFGGTRAEWGICDIGGLLAGAVTVGAYPTLTAEQLWYLLEHSDTKVLFVQGKTEVDKLLAFPERLATLQKVIVWDADELEEGLLEAHGLVDFRVLLRSAVDEQVLLERVRSIQPDDTAIIVYTSGTTGPPKGAMITHNNVLSVLRCQDKILDGLGEFEQILSFLPMAHVAERIMSFYGRISAGIAAAYATSIPAVLQEVQEIRPTIFGSVPRIFEKAYAKIMTQVSQASPRRQMIFRWAEAVGREKIRYWQRGEPVPMPLRLQYRLADRLVFSKIRGVFGGRVRYFLVGAAPIAQEILEFFWAAGFPVYEAYGQTEATVITHTNRPGYVRLGSVGLSLDRVQSKLAPDGEILIKGPTVFKGYYKDPDATTHTVGEDGWLHTGDIGRVDDDGYYYIIDRKKHIIITAGGKNLTPANIENEVKAQESLISQVHVHGDRRPYLTAIVTVHPVDAIEWALDEGLIPNPEQAKQIISELRIDPFARPTGLETLMSTITQQYSVKQKLVSAIQRANRNLSKVERIKRVIVLERDFSLYEGEITPTLKVKRKQVEQKFKSRFDLLYRDPESGLVIETK